MKPNGLEAAASVTSIGSSRCARQASAISNASAMFTARKVLSYSLTISAASGEATRCSSTDVAQQLGGVLEAASVTAPTTRGVCGCS